MRKDEYLAELASKLHGLSEEEIKDAMFYCQEYFDEAESIEQAITDLGSPTEFASQIKTEKAIKTTQNPENYRKPRSMMKSFLMILGGLFALPIALPLLLVAILLFIVFGLVIFIFAIAGILASFALFYGSIVTFLMTFFYSDGIGDVCMQLGASLLFLGIGIFVVKGASFVIRTAIPLFVNKTSDFYQRHKKGGASYEQI